MIFQFPRFQLYAIGVTSALLLFIMYTGYRFRSQINSLSNKAERIAEGKMQDIKKERYRKNEIGNIEQEFDRTMEEVRSILSTISATSERLAGISQMLAAGTQEASASITEVSDTVQEISSGATRQNAMLDRINEKLQEHLKEQQRASQEISEASYFVLKVAQRSNVLGLNASIEAAKAGKYGEGFGVVAQEVRELATETKSSANDIAEIIEDVDFNLKRTLEEILDEVRNVKELAEQTAEGGETASESTSEQVTMISEISEASAELSDLANRLNQTMQRFEFGE